MYLVPTKHYKDRYPLDAGGIVFNGPSPKEVEDAFGERCAALNFPYVVKCDASGKYLVDVPPVKVLVFVDESAKAAEARPPSIGERLVAGKEAYPTEDEIQDEEEAQPDVKELDGDNEVSATESAAAKRARLKAEKESKKE